MFEIIKRKVRKIQDSGRSDILMCCAVLCCNTVSQSASTSKNKRYLKLPKVAKKVDKSLLHKWKRKRTEKELSFLVKHAREM
jgi:hypothetical protein